ncbi:12733_t:CDS:2 [Dentiscutata erythropus]|uniref:12733_t:CDS:1 n=1 Tax=Dentiscutata erythropus TaxID=1348616 RepID=A0A9N9EPI4_9GLOM|nr:12733_t:CDS:2 [Dentiscutata erythropus]
MEKFVPQRKLVPQCGNKKKTATNGLQFRDQEIQTSQQRVKALMLLKERWEEIEILLKRRNNLNLFNFVMSPLVILFGIAFLYIFWKKDISDTWSFGSFKSPWPRVKRNKDTVTSLVGAVKNITLPSDKVLMPAMLPIPDELINDELVGKCKNYLRFLDRIEYLINAEKTNVEKMLNCTIEPPISSDHMKMIIYTLKFIFIKPTIEVVIAILTYYYVFSKRLYLIDDNNVTLDDYGRVIFFGNKDIVEEYKVRIYGNKKSRRKKYGTIKLIGDGLSEFKKRLDSSPYFYIIIAYLLLFYAPYSFVTFLGYMIIKILPNEETNTSTSSHDKPQLEDDTEEKDIKNLAEILKFGNPMNIAEKYVIYTSIIVLRMKTGYQFKIESIEITEKQRNELRSLLCGLVQYSYIEEMC